MPQVKAIDPAPTDTPEINGFSSIHIWAEVNPNALRIATNRGK